MKSILRYESFEEKDLYYAPKDPEFKYKIRVDYRASDSDKAWDETDYIPLEWNDLSVAKANLQRIKQHREMCYKLENRHWTTPNTLISLKKFFDEYSKNDWFVSKLKPFSISKDSVVSDVYVKNYPEDCDQIYDSFEAEYKLYLYTDDGERIEVRNFWEGNMESLKCLEIESDESDTRIEF